MAERTDRVINMQLHDGGVVAAKYPGAYLMTHNGVAVRLKKTGHLMEIAYQYQTSKSESIISQANQRIRPNTWQRKDSVSTPDYDRMPV